ncbi:MAG: MucB/RseB C-terminal domain-containing protein [Pseudomonadales bacterium]|nr:MucB/RseB C-terminal domain-containing protein [Pseudomonadales bacterium]
MKQAVFSRLTAIFLFSASLVSVSTTLLADEGSEEIQKLLSAMPQAFRTLDYQGLFTLEQGGQMVSSRIYHRVEDGRETERLVSVDGPERELIRRNQSVDCLQPGDMILQGLLPQGLLKQSGQIHDHYRLLMGDDVRIANRPAHSIIIEPRDQYRFGYTLAIDKETGLLLQSKMLSADGRMLDRFQFVTIDFGAVSPSLLIPKSEGYEELPPDDCHQKDTHQAVDTSPWRLNLPSGYMFCHFEKSKVSNADALMYSDGLSTFSVFIHPGEDDDQSYFKGGTLLYSRKAMVDGMPYTVTVVGEIPESTAMRVTAGLSRKAGH